MSVTGTPEGKERLVEFRDTLDSRLRYYEGIDPFSPADVAEYIDLFARAAFVWHCSGADVDRINVTPALRDRSIAMDPPD
ncbi:hypothetical protein BRC61_06560 [Halobacteriales archaeon QH_10_65_19]|nr:MAG: hypothetical protein BRC61_06560 [Halobacteriales archaeon QH_10_65_19]